jgi:hypothetical protein
MEREISRRETHADEMLGIKPLATKQRDAVELADIKRIGMLGTGTFGRVHLVQHVRTGQVYALKSMMKAQVSSPYNTVVVGVFCAPVSVCVQYFVIAAWYNSNTILIT